MKTGTNPARLLTLMIALLLALGAVAACDSAADEPNTGAPSSQDPAEQLPAGDPDDDGYPGMKLPENTAPESGYPGDDSDGDSAEEPADGETGFVPLDADACAALADAMATELGVDVATADADFADYVTGDSGTGCDSTAGGTGVDFESYVAVADSLRAMLEADGWTETVDYAADGPTGTASGFTKDAALCLLSVNWAPSEDADCPEDQPISACELEPEQQIYSIQLNCAETESS